MPSVPRISGLLLLEGSQRLLAEGYLNQVFEDRDGRVQPNLAEHGQWPVECTEPPGGTELPLDARVVVVVYRP